MKAHLAYLLLKIRESFWFLPILMVVSAFALAHGALYVDRATALGAATQDLWFGSLDTDAARVILSTVTGAMITTASLVFSLTLVSLTLASQQLGPRLLSLFLRDRMTQTVLGLFLATFIYALVVLMAMGGEDGPVLVPMLSILLAVTGTIASFVALIVFIHHLSTSLQADVVVARVAAQLREQIETYFPDLESEAARERPADDPPAIAGRRVPAVGGGYIQAIDHDELVSTAREHDLQIHVLRRPGHFVCAGEAVAVVSPADADPDLCRDALERAVVFGAKRTAAQDVEFALMAIVEIALRALSPGINDPHTANTCVDRLSEGLLLSFGRRLREAVLCDDDGTPRVVRDTVTTEGLMNTAFNEIRQCAGGSVSVIIHLAEALARLAEGARTDEQRAAIAHHRDMLARTAEAHVGEPSDLEDVHAVLSRVDEALSGPA